MSVIAARKALPSGWYSPRFLRKPGAAVFTRNARNQAFRLGFPPTALARRVHFRRASHYSEGLTLQGSYRGVDDRVGSVISFVITVKVTPRRIGSSQGVIIPNPLLAQTGFATEVEMSIEHDAIVLRKPHRKGREGWEEAGKAIAAVHDDVPVWPEFANEDDAALSW
jgi:antitoxin MazE